MDSATAPGAGSPASVAEFATFHGPCYVDAQRTSDAATAVGGSMFAAEPALDGRVTFHPSGGTHHVRRDRASGFCCFNDPVFAFRRLLQRGLTSVFCVDLEAHHADGVQEALLGEAHVRVVSIHGQGRCPYTGEAVDTGHGYARAPPVPAGLNDDELAFLLDEVVLPLREDFRPGAVVLGGGGYNPWTLARCRTGLLGRLTGREVPAGLPARAKPLLQALVLNIIRAAEVAGAEVVATECPTCHSGLEMHQVRAEKRSGQATKVRIIYFTQLLGLALGLSPRQAGMHENVSDSMDFLREKGVA